MTESKFAACPDGRPVKSSPDSTEGVKSAHEVDPSYGHLPIASRVNQHTPSVDGSEEDLSLLRSQSPNIEGAEQEAESPPEDFVMDSVERLCEDLERRIISFIKTSIIPSDIVDMNGATLLEQREVYDRLTDEDVQISPDSRSKLESLREELDKLWVNL